MYLSIRQSSDQVWMVRTFAMVVFSLHRVERSFFKLLEQLQTRSMHKL